MLGTLYVAQAQTSSELLIQANRATLERQYTKALTLYDRYIELNPKDFRGYFNRGTTGYNAKRYNDALKDFDKTIGLNPIYREAYYYRGLCSVELGAYVAAIDDYSHILKKEPNSVPFLKVRADAYVAMDSLNLAKADLDKAIRVNKLSGDLYKKRAELQVNMHNISGAIRDYNSVEKLIPAYKMVHYIKGNLYIQIGDIEFACDEYKKALEHRVVVAERSYNQHCTQ